MAGDIIKVLDSTVELHTVAATYLQVGSGAIVTVILKDEEGDAIIATSAIVKKYKGVVQMSEIGNGLARNLIASLQATEQVDRNLLLGAAVPDAIEVDDEEGEDEPVSETAGSPIPDAIVIDGDEDGED
jgi:hypothetical protein